MAIWNRVFRSLSAGRGLDIATNARLFAMENLGAADAAIGCWADKYDRNSWRPITAIREAETDGNRATKADPTWTPLFDPATPSLPPLVTPGFPEHPSGHTCITGAIVHGLRRFFKTGKVALTITSARFPGQARTYDRFSAALDEVIEARVWAGIHFRTADVQGARLGRKVEHWLRKHALQCINNTPAGRTTSMTTRPARQTSSRPTPHIEGAACAQPLQRSSKRCTLDVTEEAMRARGGRQTCPAAMPRGRRRRAGAIWTRMLNSSSSSTRETCALTVATLM